VQQILEAEIVDRLGVQLLLEPGVDSDGGDTLTLGDIPAEAQPVHQPLVGG